MSFIIQFSHALLIILWLIFFCTSVACIITKEWKSFLTMISFFFVITLVINFTIVPEQQVNNIQKENIEYGGNL
jgi:energy-coupling factor transporter transmembrane protein EcfT